MVLQVELTHTWSDGSSTSTTRDFTSAATYTVTGTDASNGCTNTADITITVDNTQPTVVITNNETASSTEVTVLILRLVLLQIRADLHAWSDGSSTSTTRDFTSAATYTVTGTDAQMVVRILQRLQLQKIRPPLVPMPVMISPIGCTDNASGSSIGVTDEAEIILHGLVVMTKVVVLTHGQFLQLEVQGYFLGNPSNNGMGTSGIGSNAFGFYATGGDYLNASRPLTNAMAVGDELTFWWAMNWDANGGGKGFDFKSGGTTIFTVLNSGSTAAITTSSGGTADGNYGTTPMLVTLTRTSSSEYTFQMTGRSSGFTHSETISSSSAIDEVNIFIGAQNEGNGNRNIYFNKFNLAQSGANLCMDFYIRFECLECSGSKCQSGIDYNLYPDCNRFQWMYQYRSSDRDS